MRWLPSTAHTRAIPALARRRRRLLQGHCRHLHLRLLPRRPHAGTPTALSATILTTATVAASIAASTIAATFTTARRHPLARLDL